MECVCVGGETRRKHKRSCLVITRKNLFTRVPHEMTLHKVTYISQYADITFQISRRLVTKIEQYKKTLAPVWVFYKQTNHKKGLYKGERKKRKKERKRLRKINQQESFKQCQSKGTPYTYIHIYILYIYMVIATLYIYIYIYIYKGSKKI